MARADGPAAHGAVLKDSLALLVVRELRAVKRELDAYPDDDAVWREIPGVPNTGGTLALHVAGNLRHFIGAVLARDGYVRDRQSEFSRRGVPRAELHEGLDAAIAAVQQAFARIGDESLAGAYPEQIAGRQVHATTFALHLLAHLAYHLGQMDTHRRAVSGNPAGVDALSVRELPALASSDDGPELRSEEVRGRVVRLAFDGDRERYVRFLATLREAIPPDVTVILRGSAVTGTRWRTDEPFDADGPGTSDLDLTLVSGDMVKLFDVHYIPGLHTAPLSEAHPDASATLTPLRQALCAIAGRPVNIQATSNLLQFVRDVVMSQPYFVIIEPDSDSEAVANP